MYLVPCLRLVTLFMVLPFCSEGQIQGNGDGSGHDNKQTPPHAIQPIQEHKLALVPGKKGDRDTSRQKNWTYHFQLTAIQQFHGRTHFAYSGVSSLDSNREQPVSLTTTLFIGRRLWNGSALYLSPELIAGNGFSGSKGFAGFPNGEIYRVGTPTPTPFIARLYIQQNFPLGRTDSKFQIDEPLQLEGFLPASRITVNVGKFCLADFFDDNAYDHDARSQFLNWSLMANGAWDFAADTRGYTAGIEAELVRPRYTIKFAFTQLSKLANGLELDYNLLKSNALAVEFSTVYTVLKYPGVIRLTGFRNTGRAPRYSEAVAGLKRGDTSLVSVIAGTTLGTKFGGIKLGFGLNLEQPLSPTLGVFFRAGWNDGQTASWEFTDIDNTFQGGLNLEGRAWGRSTDTFGLAFASNGISQAHQNYFSLGGHSFIIGDGQLRYGREQILEAYYRARLGPHLFLSGDYQLILNPGYNQDRQGPISIPAVRLHIEL